MVPTLHIYSINMYQFISLHLAISDKLGWGDMLAEIALPAIQQILENAAKQRSAQMEKPVGYESIQDDLLAMSAEDLFVLLCSSERLWEWERHLFLSLRGEIETRMRNGDDYQTAINEWFK